MLRQPRYVRHILKERVTLDSASFLFRDGIRDPLYCISDVNSPIVEGERPIARFSLIKEAKHDFQLRIAIVGDYRIEKPRYYVKDPNEWLEWGWIIIPHTQLDNIELFIQECKRRIAYG